MRYRHAHVGRIPASLGHYPRGVRGRETEGGRPERGASASFSDGDSHLNRFFHLRAVR